METYEEIFNVIKKWFDSSLNTNLNIPEDLSDGSYYLKLLKTCVELDIPNMKNKNYEKLEIILNEFYGFQTNCVVDYIEFFDNPVEESIISLCILCFVFCKHYKKIPLNLTQDDCKRLLILINPVNNAIQMKQYPLQESFHIAIEKAKIRELEDISLSSISLSQLNKSTNDHLKNEARHNGSDDDISTSSNMPSFISESSFHLRSIHDSVTDIGSNDRSKNSLNRKNKNMVVSKVRRNQNIYLSPAYRRSVNSPKLSESRKLEQRRIKNLEFENHSLKQDVNELTEDVVKLEESERKLNMEIVKLKGDNRKLMDDIDCMNSKIEETTQICSRKDKELEKFKKDFETNKKMIGEKCDEIKQLEISNRKLRQDIHDLNNKLKNKSTQYDESMKIKVDISQENRVLENENEELKNNMEELQRQIRELSMNYQKSDREHLCDSPISNIEQGESLDIINQLEITELRNEFSHKKNMLENEIKNLKQEIKTEKNNSTNLSVINQEMIIRCNDISAELDNYHILIDKKEKEIIELQENNNMLLSEKDHLKEQLDRNSNETSVENITNTLNTLLIGKEFSNEEKNQLLKSSAECLDIDLNSGLKRSHEICQKEISTLYQKLKISRETNSLKQQHLDEVNKILNETENHCHLLKQELEDVHLENEEMARLWQNQKSKSDETEFKLKKTLFAVEEERRDANTQNNNLKRDLLIRERELQKSNQEFNILRGRYDKSLEALHKMAKDCEDYEQVITEITENQRKQLRSVMCQTELDFNTTLINTSNMMSSRTNNILDKGNNSFRRHLSREMPSNTRYNDILYVKKHVEPSSLTSRMNNYVVETSLNNDSDSYYKGELEYQNNYSNEKLMSPRYIKNNNHNNSAYIGSNTSKFDPKWVSTDKTGFTSKLNSKTENKKIESPCVKPARIHQMISRNQQQPEHLKSSYPVETQGVEQDYLAHCLLKQMKLDDSEVSDLEIPETTARSSNIRYYAQNDQMNLRPNINSQAMFTYDGNSFSDNLIKGSSSNGLTPRNIVLSARSNNINTPKNDYFKRPTIPNNNNNRNQIHTNRDSDRENMVPVNDNKTYSSDRESLSSSSMRFEIMNSPRRKIRGIPGGYRPVMDI